MLKQQTLDILQTKHSFGHFHRVGAALDSRFQLPKTEVERCIVATYDYKTPQNEDGILV